MASKWCWVENYCILHCFCNLVLGSLLRDIYRSVYPLVSCFVIFFLKIICGHSYILREIEIEEI